MTTKPARSWESMHCLPSVSSANVAHDVDRLGLGHDRGHELDQREHRHGVEEVHAEHAAGVLGLGAELHDRHGRGVRGQELRVGQQLVEPAEDAALELLVLDHGLDRGVDAVEVLEDRGHDEVVERRRPAVLVELAGLHGAPQRALDRVARTLRTLVVGLDDRHVHAGPGTHLRDARAHQPTTDHTHTHGART